MNYNILVKAVFTWTWLAVFSLQAPAQKTQQPFVDSPLEAEETSFLLSAGSSFCPQVGSLEKEQRTFLFSADNSQAQGGKSLQQLFDKPSDEAKPWTFWYWMYGAVSREGIKADLEAMKQIGLGGAYLMPIKSVEQGKQYLGKAEQLSPEWWEMVRYSMQEADRLGLKLGMHICDGFALAGGPWITPEESMQKVVFCDTIVQGGKIQNLRLPVPESFEGYYEDIALLALPLRGEEITQVPKITCGNIKEEADAKKSVSIDESGVIRSSVPCWIQYEYETPVTCRNVEIVLNGNNYQAHRLKVMASNDGVIFYTVKQLTPARQGWQNTDENSTHSIPATTARYFRFYWTPVGSEPGSEDMDAAKWKPNLKIKQLVLHSQPRLNQWEGKAGLVWRVAKDTPVEEVPVADCIKKEDVLNLTTSMRDGQLTATLPKGQWRILRMGHTATGHTNATGGGGKGLECNKFSAPMVRKQFDNWFGKVFTEVGPDLAHRVLKYMHVDSWECGSQNWSDNFAEEFKKRRGYDLMPYLPLLAGIPLDSAQTSERILRDVRTTIAELVKDVFYQVLADSAKEYGCRFSAECVAPTMVSDGLLHYQMVDLPMGEFWLRSPTHDKLNDMLDAISGAHIYGKNIIQVEGFTEVRGTWDETPAMLKTLLDRNYALGINKLFFHVYVHNPYMDKKPGMTLDGIGLFFQRDNTWWKNGGKALVDYITRCQALLQYGVAVTDIAVFTGEEMPRRAILPDRLVSSLPGIYGENRVRSEKVRLANVGQPLRVMPVGVTHSANMADPEDWVNPLRGYAYDSFNKDALLRLATVKDGRMVLPGGASYKVLVMPLERPMNPNNVMSDEVKAKVEALRQAGIVVPQLPYTDEDFSAYGLERDVVVPENVAWTHRRNEQENTDVYFISNQQDTPREFVASFRMKGMLPEWWNPMTGEISDNFAWKANGNRTEVTMKLNAGESTFIVFRQPTKEVERGTFVWNKKENLQVKEWTVRFESVKKELKRNELFDWSKEDDEQIRYYSGTAFYTGTFPYTQSKREGEKVWLELGALCDVASVKVNGMDCGIAWTAPYEVDITKALRKGDNTIEIEVTNSWANALNGADQGKAPYNGIWTNGKYRLASKDLLPAGLLGPVKLVRSNK